MEQLCSHITDRMIDLDIICKDDRDGYCYSIQVLIERTIGLALILAAAFYFHSLIEVASFLIVFTLIRRSSDGFHCRSTVGCFVASTLVVLSTIPLAQYLSRNCAMCIGGAMLSMMVLCIIATFDNPDMDYSERELNHLKRRSRITVLMVGCVVVTLIFCFPHFRLVSFMVLGIMYNAASLLIVIMMERRKTS